MNKWNNAIWMSLAALLFFAPDLFSDDDEDVALVLKTLGNVQLNQEGRQGWRSAQRGHRLNSGEIVRTSDRSLAAIVFTDDKSLLKVRANSRVKIQGKREEKSIFKKLTLGFGEIWAKVTKQDTEMRVETPSGVATVKGTEFNALFNEENNDFIIFCREGLMELFNQYGQMLLGADEIARMRPGTPPERMQVDPDSIFELDGEEGGMELRIDFEDEDGNPKSLILDLEEE